MGLQINSIAEAQATPLKISLKDSGGPFGTKYQLKHAETDEMYIWGNIHWLESQIENQHLNLTNPEDFSSFMQKETHELRTKLRSHV